jgi:FixJ family two-component response regulator
MPQMSGPELIRRLRAQGCRCAVIYMSGYPEDALARYGVTDLSATLLIKPFARHTLLERVASVLCPE